MFDRTVKATSDTRYLSPIDCECFISHREIWSKAPKASARKATAEGVNWIAVKEKDGDFYIFQVSGYTMDRGLFCDMLDRSGRVINTI